MPRGRQTSRPAPSSGSLFLLAPLVAVLVLATQLAPRPAAAQSWGLGVRVDLTVDLQPRWVSVGDLNADGKLDLVSANYGSNTVSVLLGNGAGGFSPRTNFVTGTTVNMVAIGDLNRDGKPDLATANYGVNTVSVLLGNGAGGFGAKTDLAVGLQPQAIAIADLNADGRPDLACVNGNSNSLSVLLQNAAGGYARTDFTTPSNPIGLTIADVDNDGRLDAVTSNFYGASVSLFRGNGAGGFGPRTDIAVGVNPGSTAVGDVNDDGKLDLAVATQADNTVSVRLGDGLGGFGAATSYPCPASSGTFTVLIGDVSGDGKADLLASGGSAGNSMVSVFPGDGAGAFGARTDFAAGPGSYCMAIADLNRDGSFDLITANLWTTTLSLLLGGQASGGFAPRTDFTTGTTPQSVVIGDLNLDGKPDLAVANSTSATVSVLLGNGTGGFGPRTDFATALNPRSVTIGDVNLDGRPDLAVANSGSASASILIGNGAGGFAPKVDYAALTQPAAVALRDVSGDGRPDLIVGNIGTSFVSVLVNDGTGTFPTKVDYGAGGQVSSVGVGDLNADGQLDLVTTNIFSLSISVMLNAGGSFPTHTEYTVNGRPGSVGIADFNGDGRLDLAVTNFDGNNVSVLLSNGTGGTFSPKVDYATGTSPQSVGIGDLNGDGRLDLAVANGNTPTISTLLGNGAGAFAPRIDLPPSGSGVSIAVGDLNADGRLDLAEAKSFAAQVGIHLGLEPTVVGLQASPDPCVLGAPLTLTATISVPAPGSGTPAGSVRFYDGSTLLGTAPVNGGAAGLVLFAPRLGVRSYTAVYGGDTRFFGGVATATARTVPSANPAITSIADVGQDQGHQVRVRFRASGFDVPGSMLPIARYDVYRRIEPGFGPAASRAPVAASSLRGPKPSLRLDGWEMVGSVSAQTDSAYNAVVPTLADSNQAGIHRATFFVSAATSTPSVHYDSAPDSGYSLDNLPPAPPAPFTAEYAGGATNLHWGAGLEPDFWYYRLYRGATPDFVPGPGNLIATPGGTDYVDPGPPGSCYKLSAVDMNGNESAYALVTPQVTTDVHTGSYRFALAGASPNPSVGARLRVSFELPDAAPARLELLDVTGRRVALRDVGAFGAGRHVVDLAAERPPAGHYFVRLVRGRSTLKAGVTVLE